MSVSNRAANSVLLLFDDYMSHRPAAGKEQIVTGVGDMEVHAFG